MSEPGADQPTENSNSGSAAVPSATLRGLKLQASILVGALATISPVFLGDGLPAAIVTLVVGIVAIYVFWDYANDLDASGQRKVGLKMTVRICVGAGLVLFAMLGYRLWDWNEQRNLAAAAEKKDGERELRADGRADAVIAEGHKNTDEVVERVDQAEDRIIKKLDEEFGPLLRQLAEQKAKAKERGDESAESQLTAKMKDELTRWAEATWERFSSLTPDGELAKLPFSLEPGDEERPVLPDGRIVIDPLAVYLGNRVVITPDPVSGGGVTSDGEVLLGFQQVNGAWSPIVNIYDRNGTRVLETKLEDGVSIISAEVVTDQQSVKWPRTVKGQQLTYKGNDRFTLCAITFLNPTTFKVHGTFFTPNGTMIRMDDENGTWVLEQDGDSLSVDNAITNRLTFESAAKPTE